MKKILVYVIAVIHVVSITGCATQPSAVSVPTVTDRYQIPAGAKVGLASELDPAVNEPSPIPEPVSTTRSNPGDAGKLEGFGKDTIDAIAQCSLQGLIIMAPFCVVVIPLMFASFAAVGVVAEVAVETAKGIGSSTASNVAGHETTEAAEREVTEKILEPLSRLTPFPDRIQKNARAAEVNGLVKVTNDAVSRNLSENARLRRDLDYVFEFYPTEVKALKRRRDGNGEIVLNTYAFVITAKGRLVRLSDNLIVSKFERFLFTDNVVIKTWATEETELLAKHLNGALEKLAEQFVNEWINPALPKSH